MAKLVLDDLANLRNETTVVARINSNLQKIEDALENTLSRDGTSPNTMQADLDVNGYFIRNHPEPVEETDLTTKGYVDDEIDARITQLGDGPTALDYREFTPQSGTVSEPTTNHRLYVDDEEQVILTGNTSSLGAPFILPTWYDGNITVTTSDPWERIFRRHTGNGVITLSNGTYDASALLTGSENGLLDVRGATMGGATLKGNWSVNNRNVNLSYMNLLPEDNTTAMFVFTGGKLALSQTGVVDISAYTNQKATLGQFVDAHFHCTAGPLALSNGMVGRDVSFVVGGKITSQVFDLDSGCSIKFVGYEPSTLCKISYTGAECAYALILDASSGLLTGTHITGAGKAVTTSNGIGLRRCSTLTFANDILIKDFYHGIRPIAGSHGYMLDGEFENCTYAIRKDSGYFEYVEADTVFTNVTTVARSDSNVNRYAGGAPSTVPLNFNTGGVTVAAGATTYIGNGFANTSETQARWRVPCAGVLRNLYPTSTGAAGVGQTYTYTVRVNTADTAITCTTSDTTINTDTTHSAAVSEGDYVCIKLVTSAGASVRAHNLGLLFEV